MALADEAGLKTVKEVESKLIPEAEQAGETLLDKIRALILDHKITLTVTFEKK